LNIILNIIVENRVKIIMNQNKVYSLPDILSRSKCIIDNQSFSFQTLYTVWNQDEGYGGDVTHFANYDRHMADKEFLDDIKTKLLKSRIPTIKKMLDKNTSICSDICQLIAEYYVKNIDLDDYIIQYTKMNFSYPLEEMYIGIEHNAGGMDCMYVIKQYSSPTKTIDFSNIPNPVFWLKKPKDLKELCASFTFRDTEASLTSRNRYVYRNVSCNVDYKLFYVPNGRSLKKLTHILSGCIARHNGSTLVKEEYKAELYYDAKISAYYAIPTWLYEENETPDCIIAKPEYKEQVNNLLPNYYLKV